MPLRVLSCSLAFAAAQIGLLLLPAGSLAQPLVDNKMPGRPDFDFRDEQRMRAMRDGKSRVGGPEAEKNAAAIRATAEYFIYAVNSSKFYGFESGDGQLKRREQNDYLDAVFTELRRYLLIPTADSRLTTDQAEYIAKFGEALDEAIRTMLASRHPIVRVNAARALAVAAESGAPAHAVTITKLLTDPKTRPEVLLYAYKATAKLLAAYDPLAARNPDPYRHSLKDEQLVPLIQALEAHILKNPPVAAHVAIPPPKPQPPDLPPPAAADGRDQGRLDAASLTSEQIAVIRYFRREAVRALAEVRYDIVGGKNEIPEVRPAFTLALVASSSPSISPGVTTIEVADAVVGLLRMAPSSKLNIDELAQVIAAGLTTIAQAKGVPGAEPATPEDHLISWKLLAARLTQAFATWRNNINRYPRALAFQELIRNFSDVAMTEVVARLDRDAPMGLGGGININRINEWRNRNKPKDPGRSLFNDSPQYKVFRPDAEGA